MTDNDYEAVQAFHKAVRVAYHVFLRKCENPSEAAYLAQDGLSLFSPWMNKQPEPGAFSSALAAVLEGRGVVLVCDDLKDARTTADSIQRCTAGIPAPLVLQRGERG